MQSMTFKLGRAWNRKLVLLGLIGMLLGGLMVLLEYEVSSLADPHVLLAIAPWLVGAALVLTVLRWLAMGSISISTDRIVKRQFLRKRELGWNEVNLLVIRRHRNHAPAFSDDPEQGIEASHLAAAAAARTDDWIIQLASEDGRELTINGEDLHDHRSARLTLMHVLRDRLHDSIIFDRMGFLPAPWRDRDEPAEVDRAEDVA